jgi:hypothetical protein
MADTCPLFDLRKEFHVLEISAINEHMLGCLCCQKVNEYLREPDDKYLSEECLDIEGLFGLALGKANLNRNGGGKKSELMWHMNECRVCLRRYEEVLHLVEGLRH